MELVIMMELFSQLEIIIYLVSCLEHIVPRRFNLLSMHFRLLRLCSMLQRFRRNRWAHLPSCSYGHACFGTMLEIWRVASDASSSYSYMYHTLSTALTLREQGWDKGFFDDCNRGSNGDLDDAAEGIVWRSKTMISFFKHQFRVKFRYDRKCLDRITFNKRWMEGASLVVRDRLDWYLRFLLLLTTAVVRGSLW